MRISDWSSDVCSSDLDGGAGALGFHVRRCEAAAYQRLSGAAARSARHLCALAAPDARARADRSRARAGLPRSEEHTSELQSLMRISYAVFCLKKKKHGTTHFKHTPHNYTHQQSQVS